MVHIIFSLSPLQSVYKITVRIIPSTYSEIVWEDSFFIQAHPLCIVDCAIAKWIDDSFCWQ